jgi:uncharacterized protein (DUF2235 family)
MSKKIILCVDGAWNTSHGPAAQPNGTNVRKLYELVLDDPCQLKYCDSAVHTDGLSIDSSDVLGNTHQRIWAYVHAPACPSSSNLLNLNVAARR